MKDEVLYTYYIMYLNDRNLSKGHISLLSICRSEFDRFVKKFENDEKVSKFYIRTNKINKILDDRD